MTKTGDFTKEVNQFDTRECSSTPFWNEGSKIETISISSLHQCPLNVCSQCCQFLSTISVIFDKRELPLDLVLRKGKLQPKKSSMAWVVEPDKYNKHVQGIEIMLNSAIQINAERNIQGLTGWTGQASAWELPKLWIKSCIRDHATCDKYMATRLPDRVIDVSEDPIKLYQTTDEHEPCTCLSHCWGKTKAECATSKDNLASQMIGIRWESLPQTFKDAILFNRGLGIRYIWIDSVCIVQDDFDDWRRQATQMASIYSGSYVTIAATASASDHEGCFRNATNDPVGRSIEINNDTKTVFTLRVRAQVQTHWMAVPCQMMCDSSFGDLGDDPPPLFTRAWCFKELLLSPRVVRFDEWEVSWCCKSVELCSCGFLDKVAVEARSSDRQLLQLLSNTGSRKQNDAADLWRTIIHNYGRLLLTYKRDKLPAIAAVAEMFSMRVRKDDVYLAGSWRSSIIIDMLWFNAGEENKTHIDRQEWLAPTWSWASCGGKPDYYFGHKRSLAKVIDLHCKPVREAPFAQLQPGAYIILSGTVVTGIMIERKSEVTFSIRDDTVDTNDWRMAANWAIMDIPLSDAAGKEVTILCLARDDVFKTGDYWIILQNARGDDNSYERVDITLIKPLLGAEAKALPERIVKII